MKSQGPKRSEVALAAGVSGYTVSMVLRNLPGVSIEKRNKVIAAANKLGYRINPVAAMLAQQKTKHNQKLPRIAILSEGNFDIRSLIQEGNNQGLDISHRKPSSYSNAESASRHLWHEGFSGLFIDLHEWPWSVEETLKFNWNRFSNVKFSRQFPELKFHVVRLSPFDYINSAITHVVSSGYKNIGITLLNNSGSQSDDDARWGALLNWQHRKLDKSTTIHPFRLDSFTESNSLKEQIKWLNKIKPDALILYHWFQYQSLAKAYPINKLKKLSICSILSSNEPLPYGPIVSGFDINKQETNLRACQLMKQLLMRGETGSQLLASEIVIKPQWISGETFLPK